ncbi:MAG: sigma-70 family RNA polymerase sigma factor [Deltaproteobacteria bacterium]|nr:sigma-70 family RNA polymerase sigma factor [Deltaproteobacteria bacterium]
MTKEKGITEEKPAQGHLPENGDSSGEDEEKLASYQKDAQLIAAFKKGDQNAFQELVLKYESRVYNHCLRMINDEVESFDLTQEVFLKVFRKIKNYEHTYSFYTWLYRITVNSCIDYMRRRKRGLQSVSLSSNLGDNLNEAGREQDVPDTTYVPTTEFEKGELSDVLNKAIAELSDKLKVIIVLKEMEGFSYEEIAEILGVSRGTVKSRLFRARERLKELLTDYIQET